MVETALSASETKWSRSGNMRRGAALAEAALLEKTMSAAQILPDEELRKPQYRRLAAYGHMGRIDLDPMPRWECTDRADAIRRDAESMA